MTFKSIVTLYLSVFSTVALAQSLPSAESAPIRGITFPAISPDGKSVCFSYLGDLWTASSEGGRAARLTIHEGHDAYPRYSPDGKWIAFASNRYPATIYNYDIYVMPSSGGAARRLTYSTINDYPNDWSPDGTRILFYGMRGVRTWQLYSLEVKTGIAKQVTDDPMYIRYGAWSPDGKTITYTRAGGTGAWTRPRYKGSANMEIYSKNLATGKVARLTEYEGMDVWPMYSRDGRTIYYVSDRLTPGTPNLVSAPASGGKPALVTRYTDGAVRWPSISRSGEDIVYERDGELYLVTSGSQPRKLRITAPTDEKENEIIRLNLANGATEVEVSPDGKTLAMVVRGEIWTIPADKGGDAERLTDNPANDHDIYWSPDNSKIAFVSDRNGQFDIFALNVKTKTLTSISAHPDDENAPKWSPDGKFLAFLRSGKTGGLYIASADGAGEPRRIAESLGNNLFTQGMYAAGISSYNWSPDGKWLAFARTNLRHTEDLWLVPSSGGAERNITYFPGRNNSPEWSPDGKYLVFLSSRDRTSSYDLYSLPLKREKPPEGDEKPAPKADEKKPVTVEIEWDEIEDRAIRLTTQGASAHAITPDSRSVVFASGPPGGPSDYWSVPPQGGSVQRLTSAGEGTMAPRFQSDGAKFYALGPAGTIKSFAKSGGAGSTVAFSMTMRLNRRLELSQAFNEFWRRLKVGFYDPGMHGVDWLAARKRYEPLLAGVGAPEDFWTLLSEMVGELNASHTEVTPANPQPGPSTAELGLDYDQEYTGPGIRVKGFMPKGPNDELGPKIKPGEFIMQVDGENVTFNESFYDLLLAKAGKNVELLVNSSAVKLGARTVKLKAITREQWLDLEYEQRVKTARDKVDKLSSGRLAYSHIRAMNQDSLKRLERELWGKAQEKEGVIIDIRGNTGGNTHDDILAQLSRAAYGFTQPRDAPKYTEPTRSWSKPIVVLIDQNSVSDAEIFPNGFRQLKLGKIVGMPTPGYVIGTYPGRLQDGTGYRIPLWGWFDINGKNLENNGVQPDIRVEHTDADLTTDRDRQLEVAVETLLSGLSNR